MSVFALLSWCKIHTNRVLCQNYLLRLLATSFVPSFVSSREHTMWPGDLAPDHPDFRPLNLPLCSVDESHPLSQVELSLRWVGNTLC